MSNAKKIDPLNLSGKKWRVRYSVTVWDGQTDLNVDSEGCNSICFFNAGTVSVIINRARSLQPGEEFSLSNYPDEVIDQSFILSYSAPDGVTPRLNIVKKFVTPL